jgi:hypothetical protein
MLGGRGASQGGVSAKATSEQHQWIGVALCD